MTPWLPPAPFNERALNHVIISASYGRAITNDVLSLFDHRLNVHPSLIPKYRGPSPIQTAIANDDVETGVSVINMEDVSQGFDTGDVHAIEKVKIPPRASYNTLAPILAQKGGELLVEVLRRLSKGIFTKYPQDHSQATKTRMIRAKAGDVNWTDDAQRIDRLHRAYGHQRPLVTTFMPNSQKKEPPRRLILSGVFVAEFDPPTSLEQPGECTFLPELKALLVLCGNGTALVVQSVKREGKGFIAAGEWWNGIRDERIRLGR
ncbi:Methionyl-tRNA formyltransferase [Tulasnella sp. 330]|nr:Methionyl-tRNA formyltransferase [Tulasnella sp. 330]KAG8883008.1 Methionyl-tRNA formyltransferase [Tulasnella sp. 331]KAG8888504.1 Methionyl-tRNA formyltransferase [Tulasnella sp. 332]